MSSNTPGKCGRALRRAAWKWMSLEPRISALSISSRRKAGGTFTVTTTKATDPARYDLYVTGRLKTDAGEERIVSRPIPFEVTEGNTK